MPTSSWRSSERIRSYSRLNRGWFTWFRLYSSFRPGCPPCQCLATTFSSDHKSGCATSTQSRNFRARCVMRISEMKAEITATPVSPTSNLISGVVIGCHIPRVASTVPQRDHLRSHKKSSTPGMPPPETQWSQADLCARLYYSGWTCLRGGLGGSKKCGAPQCGKVLRTMLELTPSSYSFRRFTQRTQRISSHLRIFNAILASLPAFTPSCI